MDRTVLPKYVELTDAELERMEPEEFTRAVLEKAGSFGTDIMNVDNYDVMPLDEEIYRERLIEWSNRHAWLEWWNGVIPPSKQIIFLSDEDFSLKVRLSQQIIDEVKHQRLFSKRVGALGGNAKLTDYEPTPVVFELYRLNTIYNDPLELAATTQCTGEAVLLHHVEPHKSVASAILDQETLTMIGAQVTPDEYRHVKIGEDLYNKHARTAKVRRRICEIQDQKLRALANHYVEDHGLLGAIRSAPLPEI